MRNIVDNDVDVDDPLYTARFQTYITEFVKATKGDVYIKDLSQLIENLRQSSIINVLLTDPSNRDAITCVMAFLQKRPTLPQVFLTRLVAVASVKIRVAPASIGMSQAESCVATVIPANVRPPTMITNITTQTMTDLLKEDTRNATPYQCNPNNVPAMYKIKMNQSLLDQIVNAQLDYYNILMEGHRQNGMCVDSYIKTRRR